MEPAMLKPNMPPKDLWRRISALTRSRKAHQIAVVLLGSLLVLLAFASAHPDAAGNQLFFYIFHYLF